MSACKLSFRDVEEIKRLRADGETYASIARKFDVSQTLVKRYCDLDKPYHRAYENNKIVYPKIRGWLADNKRSVNRMANDLGKGYISLYRVLKGENCPTKATIDKILNYTGLTYEEAFSTDGE